MPRTLDVDAPADESAFAAAVDRAGELGLEVVAIDLEPFLAAGRELYGGGLLVERVVAFGSVLEDHPEQADPTVAAIVRGASAMRAADAARSAYRLAAAASRAARTWDEVDALLLPTIPGPVTRAAVGADPIGVNTRLGTYTTFTNPLDLCAVAVPVPGHGPRGVQVIAPAWGDATAAWLGAALLGEDWSPQTEASTLDLVVVGAHLSGLPLNHQLTERGASLVRAGRTAAAYRLYALGGFDPPRPGLVHVGEGGAALEVEVWRMPAPAVGGFLAGVPAPLCLGTVELDDGSATTGFLCEPRALEGAVDISTHGGWRAYCSAR